MELIKGMHQNQNLFSYSVYRFQVCYFFEKNGCLKLVEYEYESLHVQDKFATRGRPAILQHTA